MSTPTAIVEIRLPGWHNHDLSFFKDIRLKGNQQLQYRWEIYNLFEQVQFQDGQQEPDVEPDDRRADERQLRQGDGRPHRASHADVDSVHLLARSR